VRNKEDNFPGPRKLAFPKAKTTAMRPDGKINIDPQDKLRENR